MITSPDEYSNILSKFDVYIIPVVNPDGYEYSRQHDRMWRKTRSRTGARNLFGEVMVLNIHTQNLKFNVTKFH